MTFAVRRNICVRVIFDSFSACYGAEDTMKFGTEEEMCDREYTESADHASGTQM